MLKRIANRIAGLTMPLSDRRDYGVSEESEVLESKVAIVKKTPNVEEYCVLSKKNPSWSGGCYGSRERAEKRLEEVEMFKHMNS